MTRSDCKLKSSFCGVDLACPQTSERLYFLPSFRYLSKFKVLFLYTIRIVLKCLWGGEADVKATKDEKKNEEMKLQMDFKV